MKFSLEYFSRGVKRFFDVFYIFQRSNRGVDDLLNHGQTILETLRDQRGMMKGIRKKMLDVASMLGMSNTVMRLIERRSETDKYVLFGGTKISKIIIILT